MTKPKSTTAERGASLLQRMQHTQPKSTPKKACETFARTTIHRFFDSLITLAPNLTITALVYMGHEEAATLVRVGLTVWRRWRTPRSDQ